MSFCAKPSAFTALFSQTRGFLFSCAAAAMSARYDAAGGYLGEGPSSYVSAADIAAAMAPRPAPSPRSDLPTWRQIGLSQQFSAAAEKSARLGGGIDWESEAMRVRKAQALQAAGAPLALTPVVHRRAGAAPSNWKEWKDWRVSNEVGATFGGAPAGSASSPAPANSAAANSAAAISASDSSWGASCSAAATAATSGFGARKGWGGTKQRTVRSRRDQSVDLGEWQEVRATSKPL